MGYNAHGFVLTGPGILLNINVDRPAAQTVVSHRFLFLFLHSQDHTV